ncbi:MAG: PLP-dependent transferase [Anaerolineales bacterium]|nr:PLP-dependent transferase [Anaerolineales bacterium]MCB9127154.1 PLP-dependent transferase [Ardenticatenales bacterium]MCB9171914.1 PLP-dependent transferase [Ardenticatenales bacterium]
MSEQGRRWGPQTTAVHAGHAGVTGDLAPPLHLSTSFSHGSADEAAHAFAHEDSPIYSRWGNPTIAHLEAAVAALEGAEAALATASGMAAISTALLTALQSGDHVVATTGLYSGSYHLLRRDLPALGIECSVADATEPAAFAAAIRGNTKVIYLESPANPTFALNDLAAIVEIAQAHGLTTIIDNTFATPINQQPHRWGVDVTVHSATKYICGHGDAIAGVITASESFIQRARKGPLRNFGAVLSPFNAWLVLRGLHTLPLRMAQHNGSARHLADWLAHQPEVAWLRYPHHPSHPQYELARRQMTGGGGVLVFELHGGVAAGRTLLDHVRLCRRAVSLGDVRTLITHPASTTHASVAQQVRLAAGLSDGLVRLAVGLEDVEDLIADLSQALSKVAS